MFRDELIDTVLDHRYRIERPLGQGGMGMVYLGEHVRTGRKCAVKLLPPEAAHDEEAVKRFEREARVLGALGHPGIVGIHDFSETPDGRPFFVMDNLEGEDLACRLKRVGTLDWEDAKRVFDEISAALWAAHQAGVLHRDLKPGNVFLARSPGSPERVVLLDFGLAKGGVQDALTLTQSNMVMGTPLYMSPEQARSVGVDARSDIYSLAAMTYELLAGQPPFVGPNYTAVLASLLTDAPPKLSERATTAVPEHLDEVLDIALSKNPEDRQPDVASFATAVLQRRPAWADTTVRAIESGLTPGAGLGVATGPPSRVPDLDQVASATGPVQPSVADSASLQLAATVASDVSLKPPATIPKEPATSPRVTPEVTVDPAPTPTSPSPPERERRPAMLLAIIALVVLGSVGAAAAYWVGRQSSAPSSKGRASQASGPAAIDAAAGQQEKLAALDTGAEAPTEPGAGEGSGAPDGSANMAAASPFDDLVNKNLKKLTKVLNELPEKGVKATKKIVRKAIRDATNPRKSPMTRRRGAAADPVRRSAGVSPPAMRRAAWVPPPGVKGVLALGEYMRRGDFKGCVRAAARMPQTKHVIQMSVACALRLRDWNNARKLCLKFLGRYPAAPYARSCHNILKGYQRRQQGKQRLKRMNKQRKRERKE